MTKSPRLIIIGLDCAEPSLIFEQWHNDLPNLAHLMQQGYYGHMESCTPAITVPAWSCMMSGRDPGELGIYGFRNRSDRSYQRMAIADGRAVHVPRLWDILGQAGWKVAIVGVPGTYPPQPVNGVMVSCFLTPNTSTTYTHPPELAHQINEWVDDYLLDIPDFRSNNKERILHDIYKMCDQHFTVARHVMEQEKPDMLMLVEMGVDRIHHALWKQMDPRHPKYVPNSPFSQAIHDYYCHVDTHIGNLLAQCSQETTVLVVSDHGARPLMGGIHVNAWLQKTGYLQLKEQPTSPTPFDKNMVNWQQTRAWGEGGYYSRIFMNVRGREPEGIIPPAQYERERNLLAEEIRAMKGPDGQPLDNRVFTPQQIYRTVRGIAPDLIVYFGNLAWRSVGTIGDDELFTTENDTGPDDANHAQYGMFIYYDPHHMGHGTPIAGAQIYDILPTLLTRYNVEMPPRLRGKVLNMVS